MAGTATCSGDGGMIPYERRYSEKWFYQCIQSRYGFNPNHLRLADAGDIEIANRKWAKQPSPDFRPYAAGDDLVPEMVRPGDGFRMHTTGLTHAESGFPTQEPELVDRYLQRILGKIEVHADLVECYEAIECEDAETLVFQDDVFSLACVAYRLLSGKHPFGGAPSLAAKNKSISVEPIPGLPRKEWQILRRALSYERSDRPSDVSDFVDLHASAPSAGYSVSRLLKRVPASLRSPLAAIAAFIIVVIGVWLFQRGIDSLHCFLRRQQADSQQSEILAREFFEIEP